MLFRSIWLVVHTYSICSCLVRLTQDKNKFRRELKRILNKYGDEVATAQENIDLEGQRIVNLSAFNDLLKLAVNMNKQIFCHHSDEKADFFVVANGYAYCYVMQ